MPRVAQPTASTAPYEVHEWGLLRAAAGDVLEVGAVAPPGVVEVMVVDKPVLYFHASAPVQVERVRVEAVGGAIREHWPLTTASPFPTAIEWRGMALDLAESAGGAACAGSYPAISARPCTDLARGEECESAGLAPLVSTSATCLQASASRLPFLFYRSRTSTFTPPLRIIALPSGELRVTNSGDAAIPGWLVRMRRSNGQVRTIAVAAPAAHATITVGSDFASATIPTADTPPGDEDVLPMVDRPALPGSQEPGRQAVRLTMDQLGLDGGETDAFLRAWDSALFGDRVVPLAEMPVRVAGAGHTRVVDIPPVDELTDRRGVNDLQETDSILYFLPQAACDGVARLQFTPPPTRVNRALAIWQLAR